ncbi:MAG: DUF4159 domain-containing protein [Planctomycetaceae bacterium]
MNSVRRVVIGVLASTMVASAAGGAERPAAEDPLDGIIQQGVAALVAMRTDDGSWRAHGKFKAGPTALAAWALLECGVKADDPGMAKTLDWLVKQDEQWTYTLALRCNALARANRATRNKFAKQLAADATLLINSTSDGSYGYDSNGTPASGDNSNAHYGMMGVEAAAESGVNVPPAYWNKVLKHWIFVQCEDGGWRYQGRAAAGTGTMTLGGIASLSTAANLSGLYRANPGKKLEALVFGRKCLDAYIDPTSRDGYYLFNLSRAAMGGGRKFYDKVDWFRAAAATLAKTQGRDGSWNGRFGDTVATSQALLFLARCRRPVLMAKLEHEGDWDRQAGDVAGLTRWIAQGEHGHLVNWQTVRTSDPADNWIDARILYITGTQDPKLDADSLERIKAFIDGGGTVLSVAQTNGDAFSKAMRAACAAMYPAAALKAVPADDPLNGGASADAPKTQKLQAVLADGRTITISKKAEARTPAASRLETLRDKGRILIVHCSDDLAASWATGSNTGPAARAFALTMNIIAATVGKIESLPPRSSGLNAAGREEP